MTSTLPLVLGLADGDYVIQVATRLLQGDTLYNDVFCGTTPLAFLVQAFATRISGDADAALLGTTALLLITTVLLTSATTRALGIPRLPALAGAGVLWIWLTPLPGSLYSWWALAGLAATQYVVARWALAPCRRLAAIAGLTAGVAFCSKPNVGILAVGATLTTMAWLGASAPRPLRSKAAEALITVGLFASVVGACFGLIALSGAWDSFLSQCFTGKSVYLARASLPYADSLKLALRAPDLDRWPLLWMQCLVFWAPLAIPAILWKRVQPSWAPVLLPFALAGLASAFPRPDIDHIFLAAPALALVLAAALASWPLPSTLVRGLCLLVMGAAVMQIVTPRPGFPAGNAATEQAQSLRPYAVDGKMFILHSLAPTLYRASGLRNPTRYDFPLVTPFGLTGQQSVIAAIEAGKVPVICMMPPSGEWYGLPPEILLAYVAEHLRPGPDLGLCRIYWPTAP